MCHNGDIPSLLRPRHFPLVFYSLPKSPPSKMLMIHVPSNPIANALHIPAQAPHSHPFSSLLDIPQRKNISNPILQLGTTRYRARDPSILCLCVNSMFHRWGMLQPWVRPLLYRLLLLLLFYLIVWLTSYNCWISGNGKKGCCPMGEACD